jgi:L-ascorbate metabolism protein UlaG (beta-lactamase superfamily)
MNDRCPRQPTRNAGSIARCAALKSFRLGATLAAALALWAAGNPFGAPARAAESAPAEARIQVLWLGQSAFRIRTVTGKVIVTDPFLVSNPKTPEAYRKLEALGKVDLILVTHGHADHVADAPALARLNNAPVIAPAGLAQSMQTLGILAPELAPRMNKGGTVAPLSAEGAPGVRITMVHAEHSSELVWRNPATGKDETHVGGEPAGFIIELENGFRIYHMGDTGLFGDLKMIGERYRPDLVLVPIGGHFTLDPADAAYAIRELLKPRAVIPMHYGTFSLLKGTPEQFTAALGSGAATRVIALKPGETAEF